MTKTLTAPELCDLVGMKFTRFETLRRRYRQAVQFAGGRIDLAASYFPVDDGGAGGWTKYDFGDALRLSVALDLEQRGVDFGVASTIACNIDMGMVSDGERDNWVGRVTALDDEGEVTEPFVRGSWESVSKTYYDGGRNIAMVFCNVGAVQSRLILSLHRAGYVIGDEWTVRKAESENA